MLSDEAINKVITHLWENSPIVKSMRRTLIIEGCDNHKPEFKSSVVSKG